MNQQAFKHFLIQYQEMRNAQKTYFKTKHQGVLIRSKELERELDKQAEELLKEGNEPVRLHDETLPKLGFEYSDSLSLWKLKNSHIIFEYQKKAESLFDFEEEEEEESCNYFIHFYHDGEHLIVESSNEHGEYSNLKFAHIKYVHQFTDLYKAMTGQDFKQEVQP